MAFIANLTIAATKAFPDSKGEMFGIKPTLCGPRSPYCTITIVIIIVAIFVSLIYWAKTSELARAQLWPTCSITVQDIRVFLGAKNNIKVKKGWMKEGKAEEDVNKGLET